MPDEPINLADYLSQIDLLEMVEDVCRKHGVTLPQVLRRDKHLSVVRARQAIWYAMRNHPERSYSFPDIGRIWGYDHTTVMSGCKIHRKRTGGELPTEYLARRERAEAIATGW